MSNIRSIVSFSALLALSQAGSSAAATVTKQCVQLEVPVPVVATNRRYSMPRVESTIDAIDWTVTVTTWSTPSAMDRVTGLYPVNSTFRINAQLCVPPRNGAKSDILQIATPGLGFDKRYWDVELKPEEYSYVDAAVSKGYSILTYDRLGTGKSQKPDAYDVVQIPTEVEILAGLTNLARSGKLISSSKVLGSTHPVPKLQPSKVVQVGHAYGAYLITVALGKYGRLADGAVLTGFLLTNLTRMLDVLNYDHAFARQHDPVRFGEYTSGYFVLETESCLQKLFLRKGAFEPALLAYTERIKQPEAVGEYASEGTSPLTPAAEFEGPVLLFNGEFDNFHAVNVTSYLQPNTGHALTVATNASAGYEVILQYLDSHGL
ncbi:5462d2cc-03d4-4597-83d1-91a8153b4de2 [Thermothielavioides terrestris]|uniref:5462d2cc-03d4-4597-83d1-91a8153b4de2 n=1 Tax=Thermothielavioides terrestris TaxID=2587410 RepID=A0A446BT91_9PEZI|nr:5462d2cc-03d4-4597-83d1-91a8153b4de2 [Thermothielavioides terrestris]